MFSRLKPASFRRYLHRSSQLRGWQQEVAVGCGVPILYPRYKQLQTSLQHIKSVSVKDVYSSTIPLTLAGRHIKDGSVLFSSPVAIHSTGWLLGNEVTGPLTAEQLGNFYLGYNYWGQLSQHQAKLFAFLRAHGIDPDRPAIDFYDHCQFTRQFHGSTDDPIKAWVVEQTKNKKVSDLCGVYMVGLDG